MKFKIGDKVLIKFKDKFSVELSANKATIVEIYDDDISNIRYRITSAFFKGTTVNFSDQLFWVDKSEVELDLEYYRNEKLNYLLK